MAHKDIDVSINENREPRVLIFGQSFNKNSGGGITLSNLFQNWEKDNLAVAGTGHMIQDSDTEQCENIYLLENEWIFPLNKLQRKFDYGKLGSAPPKYDYQARKSFRVWIVDNLVLPLFYFIGLHHFGSKIKITPMFKNWVKEFDPEIIYVQVSTREGILFVQELTNVLKKPLIVHMMDDWPSTICSEGLLKNYWKKKIDKDFRKLLDSASLLLSISDSMSEEYLKRYSKDFRPFHNPINLDFWAGTKNNTSENKDHFEILYAGRTGLGVNSSLETVAEALETLKVRMGITISFIIQTKETLPWFRKYECVAHKTPTDYALLPKSFSNADFLLLANDFSKKSINFLKYSMPTKVPEYMVSGTPVIVFSPEETAVSKFMKKNKCGYVITKNSLSLLISELENLLKDTELQKRLSANARLLAINHFSIDSVNVEFRKAINLLSA